MSMKVTLIGIGWKSGKTTQAPGPNGESVAMDGDTPVRREITLEEANPYMSAFLSN
jgi:hypothetical protein